LASSVAPPHALVAWMLRERVLEPADRLSAAVCVHDGTIHRLDPPRRTRSAARPHGSRGV